MAEFQSIEAPIKEIVLFEDRAQIIRRAQVKLTAGTHRLGIENVTPLVADRTLYGKTPENVRLDELRVRRKWRIGIDEQPHDVQELAQRELSLAQLLDEKKDGLSALDRRSELLERSMNLYIDSLNQQLPEAKHFNEEWKKSFGELSENFQSVSLDYFDRKQAMDDLNRELIEVQERKKLVKRPDQILEARLEIDVEASATTEGTLEIVYTVPCALWRPIHRATLAGTKGTKEVEFECEAAVWQATGEDWRDVQLRFSTARPTLRSDPPLLSDDLLSVRRKIDKKVDVEVREQVIATTGEGLTEELDELPGVDDGGETRLLEASVRTDVVSDGRMRRVPVSVFSAPAELDRISLPEIDPVVHLRSTQTNAGGQPLLAGPITLLQQSGYVGRTNIDFVAAGEKFPLGWGSDDGLRVRREAREKRERSKISGKQTITRTVELFFSNLDDKATNFTVQERILVSEIDKVKVKIDNDETSPRATADDNGIVSWDIEMPALGTKKIKLVTVITAASSVRGV